MSETTVAVLFDDCSTEHEVSRVSAASAIQNIPQNRYDVVPVGITREGQRLLSSGEIAELPDGSWEQNPANRPAFISPDRMVYGILTQTEIGPETIPVDVVLPMLHGKNGEDGTLQGLLQIVGIPFAGCPSLVSAMCMDKAIISGLLETVGIPRVHYLWFFTDNYLTGAEETRGKTETHLGYPVFVKSANSGSSVSVNKVTRPEDLDATIQRAARKDIEVVVGKAVVGQKVEHATLDLSRPEASIMDETASGAEFYDYDDKCKDGTAGLFIPARTPEETVEEVRGNALRVYRMLGYGDLTCADFFVRKSDGAVLLNELNAPPGFISISMYPKLREASGPSYPKLLDCLVQLAFGKVYSQPRYFRFVGEYREEKVFHEGKLLDQYRRLTED